MMETDEQMVERLLPAALKKVLEEMIETGEIVRLDGSRLVRKEQPGN